MHEFSTKSSYQRAKFVEKRLPPLPQEKAEIPESADCEDGSSDCAEENVPGGRGPSQCCKIFNFTGGNVNVRCANSQTTAIFSFFTVVIILVIIILVIYYGLNHLVIQFEN